MSEEMKNPPPPPQRPSPPPAPQVLKWYFEKAMVWFMILSLGPLALPLVWFHPRLKWPMKFFITVVTVLLTWLLIAVLIWAWQFCWAQWEEIQMML